MSWEVPSERVRDLMSQGAQIALNTSPEWLTEIEEAMLSAENMQAIAADPVLRTGLHRATRADLLQWATANVRAPGEPVLAQLGEESKTMARDLVRRGLHELTLDAYRAAQNAAWRRWMTIAFSLTSDPQELHELLDASARSIFHFLDATVASMSVQAQLEREELTRGTHAERREVVALILDGAPIEAQRAQDRLSYDLDQIHTAAVMWSTEPDSDLGALEHAAEALARAADTPRPLTVIPSTATVWVWVPGPAGPDLSRLEAAIHQIPGVRVAVGSTAEGIEGFRRSHVDALTTQRMMAGLQSAHRVASFEVVHLVSLLSQDVERAARFIQHTLGDLESADPELRAAVLTFVQEQCNVSRAAARLYTHRNTLLRRLNRAQQLLPRPLEDNSVHVAAALEVLHWRGTAI
ncbi:PucR family transcriptional regulator [Streptomyces sp. NPDC002738]